MALKHLFKVAFCYYCTYFCIKEIKAFDMGYKKIKKVGKKIPNNKNKTSFQPGSCFWKLRSKHGNVALFGDPQKLLQAAEEYFQSTVDNPFYRAEWRDGRLQDIPVMRPFTIHALCLYLGTNPSYWRDFKNSKTVKSNANFDAVINHIETVIYNMKYEGASSGFFNATITSRDLNLIERHDLQSGDEPLAFPELKVYNTAPPLSSSETEVDSVRHYIGAESLPTLNKDTHEDEQIEKVKKAKKDSVGKTGKR